MMIAPIDFISSGIVTKRWKEFTITFMSVIGFEFEFAPVEKCPLCRSESKRDHFAAEHGGHTVRLAKCGDCGLVYIDPAPTPKSLSEFYNSVYLTPDYRKVDGASIPDPKREFYATFQVMEAHVDDIEAYKTPPGRLLDVGCSYGAFLLEAATRGWSVTGVEPFADAAVFARDNTGMSVFQGEFLAVTLPSEYFDVITMYEVLEHVANPAAVLMKALEIARPGGILVITAPNADSPAALTCCGGWVGLKFPTHLQFFNFITTRNVLSAVGWEPLRIKSGGGYAGQMMAIARKPGPEKPIEA
jgi:SAM-dependent methyltransferase